jgi:excisionase family DNA binding protein
LEKLAFWRSDVILRSSPRLKFFIESLAISYRAKNYRFRYALKQTGSEETNMKIFDKRGAAEYLGGISVETLDRYRKRGLLPYRKIGDRVLFTQEDLDTFLENCKGGKV